tara:strand:- start:3429 stop:3953 length:525 start_codon:yes stop_codon:yes gene_type:complete
MASSELLKQAYASAADTPIHTLRILHSGLTGGSRAFVQGQYDVTATLEDASSETFEAAGLTLSLPKKGVDGRQDLNFELENVSRQAWQEIKQVIAANRALLASNTVPEKIRLEYRQFLQSDLSAPDGPVIKMVVLNTNVDIFKMTLQASFLPMADISWPIRRYYAETFPGVKHA